MSERRNKFVPIQNLAEASTAASLFLARSRLNATRVALDNDVRRLTYGELAGRVARAAGLLRALGVRPGDRVAVLSRNRVEYLELMLACAWAGAVLACQNWRLSPGELEHCLDLVAPSLIVAAPDQAPRLTSRSEPQLNFGPDYEAALTAATPLQYPERIDPEAIMLLLYTSGTTGMPKAAALSHRAEIARNLVLRCEFGIGPDDAYVAWSPFYHMGGAEYALGTLMAGGTVHIAAGFDAERLASLVQVTPIGWLLLMPGMVGRFADLLAQRGTRVVGVKVCGVMADLVPPDDIARITTLLQAPYANTFGSTETGCPSCSSSLIPIGVAPTRLSKVQSPFCEVRLVDVEDNDVTDGEPGELCMRGPTLFSGYWANDSSNEQDFRGGWFHMGDVFVRNPDGTLDSVDRRKYLIKSGGENIYPAEIERVLLQVPGVNEAAVVRQPDPTWGEVPVAFVSTDPSITETALSDACKANLTQGAVAAGPLSVGSLFVGTTEGCATLLARIAAAPVPRVEAEAVRDEAKAACVRLPGFGHPLHKPVDPRTEALLDVARRHDLYGPHCAALAALSAAVDATASSSVPVNATGAIAALLLDAGLPASIVRGVALVSRCAGLVTHIHEEQQNPAFSALWHGAERAVTYQPTPKED